jgi:hypothetical protein
VKADPAAYCQDKFINNRGGAWQDNDMAHGVACASLAPVGRSKNASAFPRRWCANPSAPGLRTTAAAEGAEAAGAAGGEEGVAEVGGEAAGGEDDAACGGGPHHGGGGSGFEARGTAWFFFPSRDGAGLDGFWTSPAAPRAAAAEGAAPRRKPAVPLATGDTVTFD